MSRAADPGREDPLQHRDGVVTAADEVQRLGETVQIVDVQRADRVDPRERVGGIPPSPQAVSLPSPVQLCIDVHGDTPAPVWCAARYGSGRSAWVILPICRALNGMGATAEDGRACSLLAFAARLDHRIRCHCGHSARIPRRISLIPEPGFAHRRHRHAEKIMFAPVQSLDPLRLVHGTRRDRYDCPDLATLDRHIDHLRRRIARLGGQASDVAEVCRADIDRLLDHRSWLTLPIASDRPAGVGLVAVEYGGVGAARPHPGARAPFRRSAA